jgi:hypothetical protein
MITRALLRSRRAQSFHRDPSLRIIVLRIEHALSANVGLIFVGRNGRSALDSKKLA